MTNHLFGVYLWAYFLIIKPYLALILILWQSPKQFEPRKRFTVSEPKAPYPVAFVLMGGTFEPEHYRSGADSLAETLRREMTIPSASTDVPSQKFEPEVFDFVGNALVFLKSHEREGRRRIGTIFFMSVGHTELARVTALENEDVHVVVLDGSALTKGSPVIVRKDWIHPENLGRIALPF